MIIPSFKHGIIRVPRLISTHNITNTGSQNYTVPAGTIYLEIEMVGAGGGGGAGRRAFSGRANSNNSGAGGGGGAYVKYIYRGSLHGDLRGNDLLNFTVGVAGSAGNLDQSGGLGGNTVLNSHTRSGNTISFSVIPTAGGGGGGETELIYNNTSTGGVGGVASNGDLNINGITGDNGTTNTAGVGSNGGSGGLNGGSSVFGNTTPAAGGTSISITGESGFAPGNGGGGGYVLTLTVGDGGSGSNGLVIIKAYG